jgi:hypothetical protein
MTSLWRLISEMNLKSWIERSEVVRNFALAIGGAIAVHLGWLRVKAANNQAEAQIRQSILARQDHVAEPVNRAAGELAHEKLEVRLAAILIMGQIRREFPDLADPSLSF